MFNKQLLLFYVFNH